MWIESPVQSVGPGAPGRTRTCDLEIRRLLLYPAELRRLAMRHRTVEPSGRGTGARRGRSPNGPVRATHQYRSVAAERLLRR